MNRFIIISFVLLIVSCANPVAPTGGPKDQKPPDIINTTMDSTLNDITIYYNENIRFQNKIILVPQKRDDQVEVQQNNKSITIKLQDYTKHIIIGESIKDLNENNKGDYPIIHLNKDTQIQLKQIKYPAFIKTEIIAQTLRDTFIYNHQVNNDTVVQCCLETIGNTITITLDENKNKTTDSFEWYSTNNDTLIHLLEPQKPKIQINQIDTNYFVITGKDVLRVVPLIKGEYIQHEDTLILNNTNTSILGQQYIVNENAQLTNIYPKIFRYQDSIVKKTTPLKSTVKKQQDTLKYDTLQVGLISLENKLSHPVTVVVFDKDRKIYQKKISSFDSTSHYLKPAQYYYAVYQDIDTNHILSEPDKILTYFKQIAIVKDVENHIDIVKTPKNTPNTPKKSSVTIQNIENNQSQKIKPE